MSAGTQYDGYKRQFAPVSATSDGDNTVIAAVPSDQQIVVIGYAFNVNAAGVITIQDTANVAVASFEFPDSGGAIFAGNNDCPAFILPKGTGLEVSNAAGVDTLGHITYIVVK